MRPALGRAVRAVLRAEVQRRAACRLLVSVGPGSFVGQAVDRARTDLVENALRNADDLLDDGRGRGLVALMDRCPAIVCLRRAGEHEHERAADGDHDGGDDPRRAIGALAGALRGDDGPTLARLRASLRGRTASGLLAHETPRAERVSASSVSRRIGGFGLVVVGSTGTNDQHHRDDERESCERHERNRDEAELPHPAGEAGVGADLAEMGLLREGLELRVIDRDAGPDRLPAAPRRPTPRGRDGARPRAARPTAGTCRCAGTSTAGTARSARSPRGRGSRAS